MDQIHPAVVHLPIAFFALWPCLDAIGLLCKRQDLGLAAIGILGVAIAGALAATVTGQHDFDLALDAKVGPELLEKHAADAELIPWLGLAVLGLRLWSHRKAARWRWLAVVAGLLLALFVATVGHSGGTLVFDHGVGVRPR